MRNARLSFFVAVKGFQCRKLILYAGFSVQESEAVLY